MMLHTADISNPCKSFAIAIKWSERVLNEFFTQGDVEKCLGLPVSPMCDRISTNIPGSQIGFIDFIVQPAFEVVSKTLPRLGEVCLSHLALNRECWRQRDEQLLKEEDSDEIIANDPPPSERKWVKPLRAKLVRPSRPLVT